MAVILTAFSLEYLYNKFYKSFFEDPYFEKGMRLGEVHLSYICILACLLVMVNMTMENSVIIKAASIDFYKTMLIHSSKRVLDMNIINLIIKWFFWSLILLRAISIAFFYGMCLTLRESFLEIKKTDMDKFDRIKRFTKFQTDLELYDILKQLEKESRKSR